MARKRDYFEIPDCAWKRGLGDVPSNTGSSCPDRGVALGGFGAATMYHLGLKKEALNAAYGCYYIVYEHERSAYWFNTPEGWHDGGGAPRPAKPEQYQRARRMGTAPGDRRPVREYP